MDSNIVTVRRLQQFWNGCKTWIAARFVQQTYHNVTLNADGTVNTSDVISYATVSSRLSSPLYHDYLLVTWGNSLFLAKAVEGITNSDIKWIADVEHDGMERHMVFTLDSSGTLRTTAIETYSLRPVVVWEVADVSQGLNALQTDIAATMNWQLTGLDFSPFKRIKIYSKGGQGSTNAGTTGAMVLEMSLDSRMAITTKGGHYVGSVLSQKPNDANRYASLTCAVSADKTSFAVLRQSSLYGTAATTNNDIGASVVMIEGYFN